MRFSDIELALVRERAASAGLAVGAWIGAAAVDAARTPRKPTCPRTRSVRPGRQLARTAYFSGSWGKISGLVHAAVCSTGFGSDATITMVAGSRVDRLGQHEAMPRTPILDVELNEDPIRLGQFLKLAGFAEHGGHAKALLEAEEVQVNGRVETRRGMQLHAGDVVAVGKQRARPVGRPAQ